MNALKTIFSRGGIPHTLVSDNGPQFKSQEFKDFLDWLGVLIIIIMSPIKFMIHIVS